MRRPALAIVATALSVAAVGAALAAGAGGPRLDGSFRMTATIQANDVGIPAGTKATTVYVFRSGCDAGACGKLRLIRELGNKDFKSTLRRMAPGAYRGTEGPEAYLCARPRGRKGEYTADLAFRVTKSRGGLARKVRGTLVVHIDGCTETIQTARLSGRLLP